MTESNLVTEFQVTAHDVRDLLTGAGGVDLVPIVEGGKQVAMRLVGVTPTTTAARLGAVDGDTIVTINGAPLDSVPAAYAAGAAASREHRIEIRGRRGTIGYTTVLVLGDE